MFSSHTPKSMSKTLLQELEELVKANVISSETARNISAYLSGRTKEKPNRLPVVVNILGALLAGLGIVLLIAHNWNNYGRLTKTILAFLPLLLGQGFCVYTLLKRKGNITWQESSAVFLFFAVASTISLISQTYHIDGTIAEFLLTWLLLTIALVYIMPSSVVALLYIAATAWYAWAVKFGFYQSHELPVYYPGLLALILPHYYHYFKRRRESNFFIWLNWLIVISLAVSLVTLSREADRSEWVSIGYIALFSVYYLIGHTKYYDGKGLFSNPFLIVGTIGVLCILFSWSFDWTWQANRYLDGPGLFTRQFTWPFGYVTIALLLVCGWRYAADYREINKDYVDPTGLSGMFVAISFAALGNMPVFGKLLVNLWILIIAIFFIRKGAFKNHLGVLNFGLTIIAILALCRFFDDQIPFVWRGIFFLSTGAGFFTGNYLLVKKRKSLKKND